jgi:SAM-dependent methyltransferase
LNQRIRYCRSCGAAELVSVLDLGTTPLANSLVAPVNRDEIEPRYPLELLFCEVCSLVQISQTVSPELLFREYVYFSSYSETMLQHAHESAGELIEQRKLNRDSLVVEIASNDGYMLKNFLVAGVPTLGIEPAINIAPAARANGIPTISEFFNDELAAQLVAEGKRADVILANNVVAHVPELNGLVAGIKKLLKPDGVLVMETPYVKDMIDGLEFDTIYHEHVFYYSLTALENLFRRHGLRSQDVQRLSIHGGSLRVTAGLDCAVSNPTVTMLLIEERAAGIETRTYYRQFADRVMCLGKDLKVLLSNLKANGNTIAAYGASAKGSTLLNVFGIGAEFLDFVVDRSPHKQGQLTPGTHLPIYPPERLLECLPDYVLLLTWNFADEILAQQAEFRAHGGRFIIPIPKLAVV